MTGDSQVNRKGNEMALCMVQREASKVNNNNRIPTVGVRITQRRKGGEWSVSFEGKPWTGHCTTSACSYVPSEKVRGRQWQRDRESSLRAQEKEVLAGQSCGAVLVTLCLKPLS